MKAMWFESDRVSSIDEDDGVDDEAACDDGRGVVMLRSLLFHCIRLNLQCLSEISNEN
jgi:hypothetical protein